MKKFIISTALLMTTAAVMANDATIIKRLQALGAKDIEIKPSPLNGIKTVVTDQGILYASEDGKYVLQGKMYEMHDNGFTDVAGKMLLDRLNTLQNEMIIYPAKNEKHVVTVFTDITCPYCHTMFEQLKQYNDLGITVRFLSFPRTGLNSQVAKQMEAVWTAKDPVFALSEAEAGRLPKEQKTPNIVRKHYNLGVQFGIRGTPSIITSGGEILGGYLPPKDLLAALEGQN